MRATSASVKPQKNFSADHVGELGLQGRQFVERLADVLQLIGLRNLLCDVSVERKAMIIPPPRFCACRARMRSMTRPRIVRAA